MPSFAQGEILANSGWVDVEKGFELLQTISLTYVKTFQSQDLPCLHANVWDLMVVLISTIQ